MGKQLTYTQVKEFIESYQYRLISKEYIRAKDKLEIECPNNHRFLMSYVNFYQGNRCNQCNIDSGKRNIRYTQKEVQEYLLEHQYTLISDYINCKEKIKTICPKGHIYECSFDNFKRGRRCCHCQRRSRGEEIIKSFLEQHNIMFEQQKTFENCRYKYKIPFDFFIPQYNLLIEYDGIQHFEEVENWGGFEKLQRTQEKDKIKDSFCKNNDITLIRIPYWEFDNLNSILENLFNKQEQTSTTRP